MIASFFVHFVDGPRRVGAAAVAWLALAWCPGAPAQPAFERPPQALPAQPVTAPVAVSAPSIGTVKTLTGQAVMEWNAQRQAVYTGMPVYEGARLVTYAGSSVGITFKDETLLAIGPDTQLVIDQYLYAPSQGRVGLMASLLRGTLNYVSGQIARLRPESVKVRTPTGTIGVRGTQFVARVDPS